MNKILSIVIPSYNTSSYIDESIKTLLASKYLDDIEIIIVDDGSTDDTLVKAEKYQNDYKKSVRVISKENGGHGSGINIGIKKAKGKYFKVIDGDDYVNTKELDRFIEQLNTNDADVFVTYFTTISALTQEMNTVTPYDFRLIENHKKVPENCVMQANLVLDSIYASIHSITYRTSILKDNNIEMTEKTFYEDNEYVLYPIPFVKSIFVSNANVYIYVIDQATQSISKINTQKRIKQLEKICKKIIEFYEKISTSADVDIVNKNYILRAVTNQLYAVFNVYLTFDNNLKSNKNALKSFDNQVRRISKKVYSNANRYRMVRVARMFNYILYPVLAGKNYGNQRKY